MNKNTDGGLNNYDVSEVVDIAAFIEETKHQIFNGNVSKARNLGSSIVSSFSYKNVPEHIINMAEKHGLYITDDVLLQLKILSVFSAEYCMNKFLHSPTLAGVAVSEFYNIIEEMYPELYAELSRTSFFAFYRYYSTHQEEGFVEKIGNQFAAACGFDGNFSYSQLGTDLFLYNTEIYKKAVQSYSFV